MPEEEDPPLVPKQELAPSSKSKNPTWVGKVVKAKDEQIEAIKELADDKVAFMVERLAAEHAEREARSKALYEIAQQRATEQQTTIKRLWIANVIQMLIIAALAGVTVTGKIPFIGDIGLDKAAEAPKTSEPATPRGE
jgi:hypothetical protein